MEAKKFEDVIAILQNLNQELQHTKLKNLIAFNHTYLIITRNVYEKFGKNYFQNDNLMEKIAGIRNIFDLTKIIRTK